MEKVSLKGYERSDRRTKSIASKKHNRHLRCFMLLLGLLFADRAFSALEMVITASPDPVLAGENVDYRMLISNTGGSAESNVVLETAVSSAGWATMRAGRAIPVGDCLATTSASCGDGFTVQWLLGSLQPGESREVVLPADLHVNTPDGTGVEFTADLFYGAGPSVVSRSRTITVTDSPLLLEIDAGDGPSAPGDLLTYRLQVGNNAVANASGVELRAFIPAGTTFVSASGSPTLVSGELSWDLGTLLGNSHNDHQFTVSVDAGATDGDILLARAELEDTAGSGVDAVAETATAVKTGYPLSFELVANPDAVLPGEFVDFRMLVSNNSAVNQNGLILRTRVSSRGWATMVAGRAVPEGNCLTTTSASCGDSFTIEWQIDTLRPGESRELVLPVSIHVNTPVGDLVNLTARLTYGGGLAEAMAERTLMVSRSPIELQIDADDGPLSAGDLLTYRIQVGNREAVNANDAMLSASVPAGTSFISASGTHSVNGDTLTWDLATLLGNSQDVQSFTVQVDAGAADGDILVARAEFRDSAGHGTDARAETLSSVTSSYPLNLEMIANPDAVVPGEYVDYRMLVSNTGATTQSGLILQARVSSLGWATLVANRAVPQGNCLTTTSATCSDSYTLEWLIDALQPGESREILLPVTAHVNTPPGTLFSIDARLSYGGGLAAASAERTVMVSQSPLQLRIDAGDGPVETGDLLVYRLQVGNRSNANSVGAMLRAEIPQGTSFVSASDSPDNSGGYLTWDLATLLANSQEERTFTVQVDATAADGDILLARAELSDSAGIGVDARGEDMTTVKTQFPLLLELIANPDAVVPGEYVNYRMLLSNPGPTAQSGLILRTQLSSLGWGTMIGTRALPMGDCLNTTSGSCADSFTMEWRIDALLPGESREILLPLSAHVNTPPGMLMNLTADLTYGGGLAAAAVQRTLMVSQSPLQLQVDASDGPVVANNVITYQLHVGNRVPANAVGAVLSAEIPEGTSLEASSGGPSITNGVLTWSLGTLPGNSQTERSFSVRVPGDAVDGDILVARSKLQDAVGIGPDARAETTSTVKANFPLSVELLGNPNFVIPGEEIFFNMRLQNHAAVEQTGVVLSVQLSSLGWGTMRASNAVPAGDCLGTTSGTCGDSFTVEWQIGTLLPGAVLDVQLPVAVHVNTPDGLLINMTASLVYGGGLAEARSEFTVGADLTPPQPDADGDGVSDYDEINVYGTNPNLADTDGDGLNDGVELGLPGYDADPSTTTDPLNPDSDNDGRLDGNNGVDPCEDCNNNGAQDPGETSPAIENNFSISCPDGNLPAGLNIVYHPTPPADLTCYGILEALGADLVGSFQRFDTISGKFDSCAFVDPGDGSGPAPSGVDFPVTAEEGYLLHLQQSGLVVFPGCE